MTKIRNEQTKKNNFLIYSPFEGGLRGMFYFGH